ncbi:hypothetical protein M409DRAFT_29448 [Zasmidium cellare ATCC 36951]|uniref:SnoaL-like domain-containing protein n=1 Tax=Zasmidium cellare ATCC 36951 TaxID=1080233 RepID=A0A6A6BZV8_ZASCE|nr:uncharacterized protein M409DRAFT_29448 [Zasmidium cellare ATCC 36951]KAF2160153.1 hypothetical protein M409DRAFT_29448 [Zasmidium cellare ATCC 36951]
MKYYIPPQSYKYNSPNPRMLHSHDLPISSQPTTPSKNLNHSPTSYLLRTLSRGLVDALNRLPSPSAYAFLDKHMSPHFAMYNSGGHECILPHVQSRQQQLDNILALRKAHPEWKLRIFHLSAVVESGGEAGWVLYTSLGEGGPPDEEFNAQQEMVGRFSWRRRVGDGVWECFMHEGIRGGGDFYS